MIFAINKKLNEWPKYFFIGFVLLLVSCSSYNDVVKGDDYQRKFDLANELFDNGDYLRSVTLYEQIYQRMPKSGEGELAYFRIGKSYYEAEDFPLAGYYLGAFTQRFPFSNKTQEAMFLSAMCAVNSSPDHTLDQSETELAISYLQQFIDTYPQSNLVDSCNQTMDRLRYKLELKDYDGVKLYDKTENYRAAVMAANTFLQDFPMSTHREEIAFILVQNSYLLTINSIENKKCERIDETKERCYNFANEFPDSELIKSVDVILKKMTQEFEVSCSNK
jgi:outer membrane protein assembly factor BamD